LWVKLHAWISCQVGWFDCLGDIDFMESRGDGPISTFPEGAPAERDRVGLGGVGYLKGEA
jgi:hypothetical protein